MKLRPLTLVAVSACMVQFAYAQTYNINFYGAGGSAPNVFLDGTSASAPIAYTGTKWNDISGGNIAATALTDSENTLSAITYESTGNGGFSDNTMALTLMQGYSYANPGITANAKFAGMTVGSSWDIYFAAHGDAADQDTSITLGGITKTTTDNYVNGTTTWTEDYNYVYFGSAVADALGEISFTWSGVTNHGAINGIQLVAVPEASSYALIAGFCALGSIMIRRRR